MITNEHTAGNNPGQQPAGYKQNQGGEQKDHEGEQNAYGQDANFDREAQQSQTHEPSKDEPFSTGNLAGDDDDDDKGRNDDNKVIPEVPQREEEHSIETPVAGKTANNEGIDRFDVNSSDQGTIDDSSKFSE